MTRKRESDSSKQAARSTAASAGDTALEWLKSALIGFALFLVIRTFLIQTFTIVSGSMEGTLLIGDFLVLSKSAYGATVPGTSLTLPGYDDPERGDIVVFRGHHEPIDLVKRIVGMPGDTIAMRDGILHVDGVPQPEPYVRHTDPHSDGSHPWMDWQLNYLAGDAFQLPYRPTRDRWGPLVVPSGQYFVLGDNRDQSLDSRYWGFVPMSSIKGRAVALYFSFRHQAEYGRLPFVGRVRWDRIGDRLR